MKNIGELLKNAREDSDLKQTEVMKLTGINHKTLSGYENGVAQPDIETLAKLFKLYGISADAVLEIKPYKINQILSREEILLIKEYRKLKDYQKADLLTVIKALNTNNRK